MTHTLNWPRRSTFRDMSRGVEVVGPDVTIEVEDDDVAQQYVDRGFERVDGDEALPDDEADQDASGAQDDAADDEGDFDVGAFLDRTPVEDVADDIEDGAADGHLADVKDAASRQTVIDAVEDRQADLNGE